MGTPLKDYLSTFEKSKSQVQNERNLRSTVPKDFAKLASDLNERNINSELIDSLVLDNFL